MNIQDMNKRNTTHRLSKERRAASALLLFPLLLTACAGGAKPEGGAAGAAPAAAGPVEFSVMTITPSTPPAADDGPIKLAIEKAVNAKLNVQWVSNNIYAEKLNITLASGNLPDYIMINNPFSSTFRTMVQQGAFWDLTPFIAEYPNISKGISKTAWETTKMADGRTYGIPRPRPEDSESFFIIRKDWLDKLGLQVPATTEELQAVMKAFVENDPDGNGKKDTTALAAYINPSDLGWGGNIGPVLGAIESSFTGAHGHWKWDEASKGLVYTALLPETRKSLEYLTEAYKQKWMPEDLLSLKLTQTRDLFKGNKAGIIVDKTGTLKLHADELKKVAPDFKYKDFYPLTTLNGYVPKGSGFNGMFAIPKSVPEAKVKAILKVIDTWMTPEVSAIQKYGLEGVHHKVENGKKITDPEKLKKDNASDFNHIVNIVDAVWESSPSPEEAEATELFRKVEGDRAKVSVPDLSAGLYSPAAQKLLPELDKKIQDLKSKIILGREPITAWDAFVTELKANPDFVQTTKEMTEAYKKRTGTP
ncbi:extracellular solute-binding protein [Paenibacillus sp. S-38]|uniref:extracellular solute-binding protein n=1 Tax=Paenibacillus sp. S-38 TaxID=3416710 RepID=UPI003CE85663